jgi:hypothetical protein
MMDRASAELAFIALMLAGVAGFLAGCSRGRGYAFKLAAGVIFCLSLLLFCCAAFTP